MLLTSQAIVPLNLQIFVRISTDFSIERFSTSTLDGWYVAGGSFILPTGGTCVDLRLNIQGAMVINAQGTGGTLQNSRNLCRFNALYPTISVTQRLDMILNAPQFLKNQQSVSQELAP